MTSPIRVEPQAYYIADQSNPANHCYVFAYRVQIHNDGDVGVQLISRSWYITDANNQPLSDPQLCMRLQEAIVEQLTVNQDSTPEPWRLSI